MKHSQNLFVVVVGIAAWLHSTWAFSTVMSGELPHAQSWADIPALLFWLVPGVMAASSIDVGLIALANKFKDHGGNRAGFVTFFALSTVSYIGQLVYTLYHTAIPLSPFSQAMKTLVLEVLVWSLPLSLPVSLVLWAWTDFSSRRDELARPVSQAEPFFDTAGGLRQGVSEKGLPTSSKPELPAETSPDVAAPLLITEPGQEAEKLPFLSTRRNGKH